MAIVGYDDDAGCWIVKNSWGTDWGEDGWIRISYDADMIADWYGENTGVMYIDGIYGNYWPDVPQVEIEQPTIYRTYLFGLEFPTILRRMPFVQEAAPRIIGRHNVKVTTENAHKVEFYIDDELAYSDQEAPFEMALDTNPGIHTIKALAYNERNVSQAIIDVFLLS